MPRGFPGLVDDDESSLILFIYCRSIFAWLVFTSSRHFSGSIGGDEWLSFVIV